MAKDTAIKASIAADSYLLERKTPTAAEQQLFLKEVSFACPLCGRDLRHRKQPKSNKIYQIAHIFPNAPTDEQYVTLGKLPRLGANSESYENRIALCKDCHDQQDYHTTEADYLNLLQKKQQYLQSMELHEATFTMGLEDEIADVVKKITALKEDELEKLNYSPVKLAKKFTAAELLLKNLVSMYVTNYYPYIRELFKQQEGVNGFLLDTLSLQIKSCFTKLNAITNDKTAIFNQLVDWVFIKTGATSKPACEAVVSFFVQNCEVFYEIAE